MEKQIRDWRDYPFSPHRIARGRPGAYQKNVFMKYLDNLIAWADKLFRRDTIESINEATQLYVLAANLLGPRPEKVPSSNETEPRSYSQLRPALDDFSNAATNLENELPMLVFGTVASVGNEPPKYASNIDPGEIFNLGNELSNELSMSAIGTVVNLGSELPKHVSTIDPEKSFTTGTEQTPNLEATVVSTKAQSYKGQEGDLVISSISPTWGAIISEPSSDPEPTSDSQSSSGSKSIPKLYFCIPHNDKLLEYWDTVEDRLFKIRHCMNIEGVERQLPLFEPPIDPALLVRATAMGLDLSKILDDLSAPLPNYRYTFMLQKAKEFTQELKQVGGLLLSALEKKDAEEIALRRAENEEELLKEVKEVRKQQIQEANETKASLERSKEAIIIRKDFFAERINNELIDKESQNITDLSDAGSHLESQRDAAGTAATWAHIPDITTTIDTSKWPPSISSIGTTIGGNIFSRIYQANASEYGAFAAISSNAAAILSLQGQFERRKEDWEHQLNLATKECEQVEEQITAAEIRIDIAEKELANVEKQIEHAKEIENFLRSKFTNQELYTWMVSQISAVYFQAYKLAYDMAKRTERAFRHELGLSVADSSFINFGYWDNLKKGLLAGEQLHHALNRMDAAYLDKNKREFETTKHVSLVQLDPVALIELRQTGVCEISIPEALFDMDYPGHYMRRIKSVSITIPAVTGPYTGVPCTLSLLKSSVRHKNTLRDVGNAKEYKRNLEDDDLRFTDHYGAIQSVITSSGQNDSGLFDPNLRDERFLPFEGAGVISTWRIEMPNEFRPFDYDTISDVLLHIRYTARPSGGLLKKKAVDELRSAINKIAQSGGEAGLSRLFSVRHEFPTKWHQFLRPAKGENGVSKLQTMTLPLTKERFPFFFQGKNISIKKVELFVKVKPEFITPEDQNVPVHDKDTLKFTLASGKSAPTSKEDALPLSSQNQLFHGNKPFPSNEPGKLGNWTINAWLVEEDAGEDTQKEGTQIKQINVDALEDVILVCHYTVGDENL